MSDPTRLDGSFRHQQPDTYRCDFCSNEADAEVRAVNVLKSTPMPPTLRMCQWCLPKIMQKTSDAAKAVMDVLIARHGVRELTEMGEEKVTQLIQQEIERGSASG